MEELYPARKRTQWLRPRESGHLLNLREQSRSPVLTLARTDCTLKTIGTAKSDICSDVWIVISFHAGILPIAKAMMKSEFEMKHSEILILLI